MEDLISKEQAIDAVNCVMVMQGIRSGKSATAEAVDCAKGIIVDNIRQLPSIQPDVSYIISETLHECGIYGEEATVKLIGTLKRLRRDDLLPPCVR